MSFTGHMSSEATQSVRLYEALAWLEANKKPLLIGFVVAVVAGFAIGIYRYSVDLKERAASEALLKLKPTPGAADTLVQPEPSAYLKVAEQYRGTSAADRALLLAAGALFADAKYAEAHAQFTKFLQARPQSEFAAIAAYGVAAALEAQGKPDDALTAYQNLSVRYPHSSVLDDAKMATARIHEAKNQLDQAFRAYEELAKAGPISSVAAEAATRRQALLLKHPELAKTNAPTSAVAVVHPTNAPAAVLTNAGAAKP